MLSVSCFFSQHNAVHDFKHGLSIISLKVTAICSFFRILIIFINFMEFRPYSKRLSVSEIFVSGFKIVFTRSAKYCSMFQYLLYALMNACLCAFFHHQVFIRMFSKQSRNRTQCKITIVFIKTNCTIIPCTHNQKNFCFQFFHSGVI